MQTITQDEALWIREHVPAAYIVITSKKKSGRAKRYCVAETSTVRYWLEKYKEAHPSQVYTREEGTNAIDHR